VKQNQCIMTKNIQALQEAMQKVWNRPKHELAGLLVVVGPKGTGKSRAVHTYAIEHDQIYIRLESKDSARSFFSKLNHILEYYAKQRIILDIDKEDNIIHGTSITMIDRCIRLLAQLPNMTVFIDEFDYALEREKKGLLDSIRDISDKTMASYVLVGMEGTEELLLKRSKPLYDRVMAFVKFTPWDLADTINVSKGISEVTITDKVGKYIYDQKGAGGSARKIIHTISSLETSVKEKV
jgi:DNA transposition AAA+ family ATPase